ncbi:MAG: hypothetical protein P8107_03015 [Spirochaetia bacterium]
MAKSAKTKSTKKSGAKDAKDSQKELLAQELKKLIKEIDVEGLIFLVKQAHVIIHNLQIDRMNREMSKLQQTEKSTAGKKGPKAPPVYPVDIEEGAGGKHYVLVVAGKRKMFARDEMRKLVAICQKAGSADSACTRMFTWLRTNRSDVLLDEGISGPRSATLASIYKIIKNRYKVSQ